MKLHSKQVQSRKAHPLFYLVLKSRIVTSAKDVPTDFIIFLSLLIYFGRQSEQGRGRERERQRETENPKQPPGSQHRVRQGLGVGGLMSRFMKS